MADTKTSETLAQEVKKQDYGIYNQGRIKLNYNDETQEYSEQYEPTEGYKMFIPPIPKDVKLPTDVTVPELPTTDPMPSLPSEPATPIVQPRDEGETAGERRRREDMERFGPGQDPMTFSKTMSNIFTPGTEQNLYYSTRGILTQDGNNLTVNFDQIDEEGGYGLPSFLGGAFKYAEKDIISGTVNRLKYAGIIEGGKDIDETKGLYTFTINREKMDKYTDNVSSLANKLTGGYRDANGNFVRRNDYLIEELGKLGKDDATKFISDMAIASDNDNMKNIIDNAIANGTRGAAAALIAFQTGEELDLDRKGLFGFTYYNDAFKEAYTNTLNELKGAEEEVSDTSSGDSSGDSTRDRVAESGDPKAQELLNELNDLLKDKDRKPEPNRVRTPQGTKSSQGLTSSQKEALAGSGGFASKTTGTKAGTGSSGPPGRETSTKKNTGSSGPPGRNYSSTPKSNTNKSNTNKTTGSDNKTSANSKALGARGL
tara:strand:+ start:1902 stop:3356 length:1455 start_codon:yes stop_codon:yes gene_type:complete